MLLLTAVHGCVQEREGDRMLGVELACNVLTVSVVMVACLSTPGSSYVLPDDVTLTRKHHRHHPQQQQQQPGRLQMRDGDAVQVVCCYVQLDKAIDHAAR